MNLVAGVHDAFTPAFAICGAYALSNDSVALLLRASPARLLTIT